MVVPADVVQSQVELILRSEVFRGSPELRRLLYFLAQKTLAGEGQNLKEYTVAVDGLGKPATYNPQHDAGVRVQVARLRQKLSEYYSSEGVHDPLLIEVPKGRFVLRFDERPAPAMSAGLRQVDGSDRWRRIALVLAALCAVVTVSCIYMVVRERAASAPRTAVWTQEMRELWRPFLFPARPIVISIPAPLFVGFENSGFYRDLRLNDWASVLQSTEIAQIRRALKNAPISPNHHYVGFGHVGATFQLAKALGLTGRTVSLTRGADVPWGELTNTTVILLGGVRANGDPIVDLPVRMDFVMENDRIRALHPRTGEPSEYGQKPDLRSGSGDQVASGESYALISSLPGPRDGSMVLSISGTQSIATYAAVNWITVPALARQALSVLKGQSGRLPVYYQAVLKVKYKASVPTAITYETHHELSELSRSPAE